MTINDRRKCQKFLRKIWANKKILRNKLYRKFFRPSNPVTRIGSKHYKHNKQHLRTCHAKIIQKQLRGNVRKFLKFQSKQPRKIKAPRIHILQLTRSAKQKVSRESINSTKSYARKTRRKSEDKKITRPEKVKNLRNIPSRSTNSQNFITETT